MVAAVHAWLQAATLVATISAVAAAPPSVFSVQLSRGRSRVGNNEDRSGEIAASTTALISEPTSRRALAGMLEVADCENLEYTGVIGLGTPVQEFRVLFSIASSFLWVVNTECVLCESSTGGYDSSRSSTYEVDGAEYSISGPDGTIEASGILSVDVLTMGGFSSAVTFGEMNEANLAGCTEVDGVIGMGLTNRHETNAFEDLVEAGVVDVPIFAFFMGNIDTNSPNGVLTLGGVNQTHYEGCLEWIHVSDSQEGTHELPGYVPEGYWSVTLKDLKIGSHSIIRSEAPAILDTGSSFIEGPFEDVAMLADMIGAMCLKISDEDPESVDFVDCMTEPSSVVMIIHLCNAEFDDINVYFGGEDYALTPAEMLQPLTDFEPPAPGTSSDPLCLFGMIGADTGDTWIFGDTFLRTFYTAYDVKKQKIGIARATNSRTDGECAADAGISSGSSAPDATPPAATTVSGGGHDSSSSSIDDEFEAAAAGGGSSGDEADEASTGEEAGGRAAVTVGVGVGLGAMALLACGLSVLAVRERWWSETRWGAGGGGGGAYRSGTRQGGGGSSFEMSSAGGGKKGLFSSMAAAHHGEEAVAESEGDFLQASPRTGAGDDGGTGTGSRPPKGAAVFGRLLDGGGRGTSNRAGFAAFENTLSDDDDGEGGGVER